MRKTATPPTVPEPDTTPPTVWHRAQVIALVVLCLTQLLEALDITVVNVALPTLRTSLGFSTTGLQWVVNGYTVMFGGFLLLGGRAGDLLGRRRVFVWGTVLFTLASLGSAVATSADTLVGARMVQGLAAGFVSPMTLAILVSIFPEGPARTRALTFWGATTAVSASLGLVVGGVLVSGPGWRWIFLVNLPVCLFVLAAALRYLPADRPAHRHRGFDAVGALTVTSGIGLLAYAVAQTNTHAWGSAQTIGLLTAAAALLGYFVVHEAFISTEPLIPLSLFTIRAVIGANIVQALNAGGIYALFFFMSLEMQEMMGLSAVRTGLAFLPLSGLLIFCAGLGPLLVRRFGIRVALALGASIGTVGLLLFARVSPTGALLGNIIIPSLVVSLGFSLMFVPVTVAAVSGVPSEQNGVASGLLNVTRTVGGALALAVVATIATNRTASAIHFGHASALASGFRLGFLISAALMASAAIAAMTLFRSEGRGSTIDMIALAAGGAEA